MITKTENTKGSVHDDTQVSNYGDLRKRQTINKVGDK